MGKILVAEDERTTRTLISKTVESMQHTAIQASNGSVALQILKDNPDTLLVLSDIAMPEVDGRQLITFLRHTETLKEIPIIVISGVVGPNEIDALLEHGADRFLPKPVDVSILKDYIVRLLSKRKESVSAASTSH